MKAREANLIADMRKAAELHRQAFVRYPRRLKEKRAATLLMSGAQMIENLVERRDAESRRLDVMIERLIPL